jgi:hypothetical protein
MTVREPPEGGGARRDAERASHSSKSGGGRGGGRSDQILVGGVLLLAAVVRMALLATDHGVTLDSDEAVIGLMARHILERGARPVFFYGQEYMGSFEAYAAAVAFAVMGSSTLALKTTMLVLDLLMVGSFVVVGRQLVGRQTGLFAGLYAAVPPAFLAIYGLKARGGYVETVTVGNLLLAGASRLGSVDGRRRHVAALGLGILAGFGFWTHTLVAIYFPAVAVIWLISTPRRSWRSTIAVALAGAALGGAPFLWRNLETGFQSLGNVHWVATGTALAQLYGLIRDALPVMIGARGIWAFEDAEPGMTALLAVLNLLAVIGCFAGAPKGHEARGRRTAVALVWLTALLALAIDAASTYGAETREPRYLFPAYTALALSFGVTVGRAWTTKRSWAVVAAAALLAGHVTGIVRQDPALMLGISAGQRVARSNDRLLAVLDKLQIRSVYTDYWVSYRLAFESGERIRARPYGHVVVDRIPEMSADVDRDPNPAFVLLGDAASGFRAALASAGLSFKERDVPPYRVFYRVEGLEEVRRWTYPFERSARARAGDAIASVTFVPPKPNEFDSAKSTPTARAALGT